MQKSFACILLISLIFTGVLKNSLFLNQTFSLFLEENILIEILKMLSNAKQVKTSRLDLKESDFQFFVAQTGLSREEVVRIFKIFDDKGGDLNRLQFKEAFESLNKAWLGKYK